MAFASLEDLSGTIELVIFPDAYAKVESLVKSDGIMIVEGVLENSEQKAKI